MLCEPNIVFSLHTCKVLYRGHAISFGQEKIDIMRVISFTKRIVADPYNNGKKMTVITPVVVTEIDYIPQSLSCCNFIFRETDATIHCSYKGLAKFLMLTNCSRTKGKRPHRHDLLDIPTGKELRSRLVTFVINVANAIKID